MLHAFEDIATPSFELPLLHPFLCSILHRETLYWNPGHSCHQVKPVWWVKWKTMLMVSLWYGMTVHHYSKGSFFRGKTKEPHLNVISILKDCLLIKMYVSVSCQHKKIFASRYSHEFDHGVIHFIHPDVVNEQHLY